MDLEDVFDNQIDVMRVLLGRLQHLNKDAEGWDELRLRIKQVDEGWKALFLVDKLDETMLDNEAADRCYRDLREDLAKLAAWVEELVESNEPPKRPAAHRRVWRRVRRRRPASQPSS